MAGIGEWRDGHFYVLFFKEQDLREAKIASARKRAQQAVPLLKEGVVSILRLKFEKQTPSL